MPELPEVETVARDLRPLIVGRTVVAFWVGEAKLRRPWKQAWSGKMAGLKVAEVRRRGKWIVIPLTGKGRGRPPAGTLLVHLGMTGQLTVVPSADPQADHTHVVFWLDNRTALRFRDIRRFGSVEWFPPGTDVESTLGEKLGPEPFDIPAEAFAADVRSSARTLKAILLDQAVVTGVGNIYADEALFRAGLHPERRGKTLSVAECDRLRLAIEEVISQAIDSRGSTIRDYVGGSGLRGGFQDRHAVYGKTGEACVTCGTPIERVMVSGRSSHFCPACQPTG